MPGDDRGAGCTGFSSGGLWVGGGAGLPMPKLKLAFVCTQDTLYPKAGSGPVIHLHKT